MNDGRPSVAFVLAIAVLAVMLGGWFFYDTFRPRHPLEASFAQAIADAQISDAFHYGWDAVDVTDRICRGVNAQILDQMGLAKEDWASPFEAKPGSTVRWKMVQNKNFFAICADHSVRYLEIALDRQTGQCHAHVSVMPSCDP